MFPPPEIGESNFIFLLKTNSNLSIYLELKASDFDTFGRKQLFLEIYEKACFYAVLDEISNQFIALSDTRFGEDFNFENFESWLNNEFAGEAKFRKVNVSIANQKSSLLPKKLYAEEIGINALNLQHELSPNEQVFADELEEIEAFMVYAANAELLSVLDKRFGNFTFQHKQSVFIESIGIWKKSHADEQAFIQINDADFDLTCFKKNDLIFCNNFSFETAEDIAYHLLNCFENLSFSKKKVSLMILGFADIQSDIYKIINEHIRNVALWSKNNSMTQNKAFDNLPQAYYFTLLNQYLCV